MIADRRGRLVKEAARGRRSDGSAAHYLIDAKLGSSEIPITSSQPEISGL
jgi:hypothetical protein